MARYICSFTVAVTLEDLLPSLNEVLKACNFEVIYDTADYLMGREVPGDVSFSRLATAEVLIDRTTATTDGVRLNLVVKNEELPLQHDNHCRQMFNKLQQAIVDSGQWQLLESASS
ncbi:MAG: hypothetical protein SAJ12_19885 [Jaaginema sp. PMC 1079.18]|nr:hypothetical protein [Jaaginema sp. PMC 1080.18]MEC4853248.1 hypothetical protein [Jaaginema sp. PMC 1079.18]MEC4867962.1 hypothetical protein [Jaaginema sp. PMC 1078.18]